MRSFLVRIGCCVLSTLALSCGGADAAHGPCSPNPCTMNNRTACLSVGESGVRCLCNAGFIDDGADGCEAIVVTADGTGIDWSESDPKYTGRFRVVDKNGVGVAGATVRKDGITATTDDNGLARLRGLSATTESKTDVEATGYLNHVRSLGFDDAGQKEARFVMTATGPEKEIDPAKYNVIETTVVAIAIPPDSLMEAGGAKPTARVFVSAVSIDTKSQGQDAMPGVAMAVNGKGQRAPVRNLYSAFELAAKGGNGAELTLRPAKEATASFALPADTKLQPGDVLGLFALDESSGRWSKQSTCRVEGSQSAPRKASPRTLDCVGVIPHFSTWAVGEEWDIYAPGQLGCINASVNWNLPSGVTASHVSWTVLECDAGVCREGLWSRGGIKYVPPLSATDPHALCGLVGAAGQSYRWVIAVDLNVEPSAAIAQPSGRYYFSRDVAAPTSFASLIGANLALNQELDAITECRTTCDQQTLTLDLATLGDAVHVDADGDGWYALSSGTAATTGAQLDCDDANPDVYPGALEGLCSGIDNNCDGNAREFSGSITWSDVSDPVVFNQRCDGACVATATEIAGNLFDENCDGKVDDLDDDGVNTDNGDCDDWNPNVNATATEIVGNSYDDDCDGETLDRDNDGYFASQHQRFATTLGINPDTDPDRFNDCIDSDADTNPSIPVSAEVGQMGALYYVDSMSDVRRRASFCDYFDAGGKTNQDFFVFRDRNCDGLLTDLDGDGFTTPGDNNLGTENAIDCNDLDLRVIPTPADMALGTAATCVTPNASSLINDSECVIDLTPFGSGDLANSDPNGCPSRLGGFIETGCRQLDAVNNINVCVFAGWNTQLPLKWSAGVLWGACDETGGGLPDCPAGSVCAGPIPFTPEYTQYITARYTTPLSNNMCFKSCDNPNGTVAMP